MENNEILEAMVYVTNQNKETMSHEDFIEAHNLILKARVDTCDILLTEYIKQFSNLINK